MLFSLLMCGEGEWMERASEREMEIREEEEKTQYFLFILGAKCSNNTEPRKSPGPRRTDILLRAEDLLVLF